MKKTNLAFLAVSALTTLATSIPAHALEQIVRPYQSVRNSGMGGVRLTTGEYEENFFGNPARMLSVPKWRVTILDLMAEVNSDGLSNIGDLTSSNDFYSSIAPTAGKNNHVRLQFTFPSVFIPFREGKSVLGIGLITSIQSDLTLRRSYELKPDAIADVGPAITYAQKFLENQSLAVGVTAHATYRVESALSVFDLIKGKSFSVSDSGKQGAHLDFDLGSTYVIPYEPIEGVKLTAAASINNLLGGKYSNLGLKPISGITALPREQPRAFGFGVSASLAEWKKLTNTVLALEFSDIGNNTHGSLFRTVHIGAETHFGVLVPRLGINQGYLCGGLGLDLNHFTLDVATYGEEMALNPGEFQDRRYAVKLGFHI